MEGVRLGEEPLPWPQQCVVTVRGLPPGVSAKEFYTRLDASPFCAALLRGRRPATRIDAEHDAWSCTLELDTAPLRDQHSSVAGMVPMYSSLEYGSPSLYLILLCWRHIPYLYHIHPPFHGAFVGPGPEDISAGRDATLFSCVERFCQHRLEVYLRRAAGEADACRGRIQRAQDKVTFFRTFQELYEQDPLAMQDWFTLFSLLFLNSLFHPLISPFFLFFFLLFSFFSSCVCLPAPQGRRPAPSPRAPLPLGAGCPGEHGPAPHGGGRGRAETAAGGASGPAGDDRHAHVAAGHAGAAVRAGGGHSATRVAKDRCLK